MASTGELDLDLAPPPGTGAPDPGDPFGSGLDSPFGDPVAAAAPSPLDDPFGSALDLGAPGPPPRALELDLPPAPSGSSSFTADPVSVSASVDVERGAFAAEPVTIQVPVEVTLTSGGREILVPIRLQLQVRIR